MTTAQGYRGTYQIINDLKEKGIKYVLIRGHTADNLALPRAYVDRLYSIYNPVERMVFLEGAFANLTTGRVYYDYDEERDRLKIAPFDIQPEDEIHVGQDLNAGFSKGTAYVKRDKTLYVVKCWSFANIGHAPKIMRRDFRANEIYWYPDASGNEVLAGYKAEMRDAEINLRVGTRNPSVVDRIFVMNKMFSLGKLKLFPGAATAPLSMALKVRQYNDNGDPEKGKGPESPDHWVDGAEYALWRLVRSDPEYFDIFAATRTGRAQQAGRAAGAKK
jgi:hypothetical protein